MGSSISQTPQKKEISMSTYRKTLPFKLRQKSFDSNHTQCEQLLSGPFGEEISSIQNTPPKELNSKLKKLYTKYKETITHQKITEQNFLLMIKELYVEQHLDKYMKTPKFNIFHILEKVCTDLKLYDKNNMQFMETLIAFQKEFDVALTKINYSFFLIEQFPNDLVNSINRQIKFNTKYQSNILTLYLNTQLLCNFDIIDDLCDLIANSPTLQLLSIIIYPLEYKDGPLVTSFGFSCASFKSLFRLIEAVSKNRNIKGLFMHSIRDYNIALPPEIFNKLLAKLQSETLCAFHFGNFKLSEGLLKKLLFQITSTRCLKFVSLHLHNVHNILNTQLLTCLKKNMSLYAFAITNLDADADYDVIERFQKEMNEHIKVDDEENETVTKTQNVTNIRLYWVGKSSLVDYVIEDSNNKQQRKALA